MKRILIVIIIGLLTIGCSIYKNQITLSFVDEKEHQYQQAISEPKPLILLSWTDVWTESGKKKSRIISLYELKEFRWVLVSKTSNIIEQ
jgi:hypothetical protein